MELDQTLISKLISPNKRQLRNLSQKSSKNSKLRNSKRIRRTLRLSRPPLKWLNKIRNKLESKLRSRH